MDWFRGRVLARRDAAVGLQDAPQYALLQAACSTAGRPSGKNPSGSPENQSITGSTMVTAAKTTSQILVHMGVAFATMYVVTGSVAFGGLAAILEPICNVIVMPLHDRLWARIRERVEQPNQVRAIA